MPDISWQLKTKDLCGRHGPSARAKKEKKFGLRRPQRSSVLSHQEMSGMWAIISANDRNETYASSMILLARPTVPPVPIIIFIWNLFCFAIIWKVRTYGQTTCVKIVLATGHYWERPGGSIYFHTWRVMWIHSMPFSPVFLEQACCRLSCQQIWNLKHIWHPKTWIENLISSH